MLSIFYVLCCTRRSPKAERDGDKKFVRNTDFLCNNAFYHFLVFFSFGNYYRRLLFSSRVSGCIQRRAKLLKVVVASKIFQKYFSKYFHSKFMFLDKIYQSTT